MLCSMCFLRGVNVEKLWTCPHCGERHCSHFIWQCPSCEARVERRVFGKQEEDKS